MRQGDGEGERLRHLDGLRGVAALSVVIGHAAWPNHLRHYGFAAVGPWVDFFFVLSGFVIALSYRDRLASGYGVWRYMGRRLARIYPAHFVVLLALLAYELAWLGARNWGGVELARPPALGNDAGSFLASLALVQSMGLYESAPWNRPAWSISTEIWTYLLYGLIFACAGKTRTIVLALTTSVALLGYAMILINPHHTWLNVEADYAFFRCLIGFSLGVICFIVANGRRRVAPPSAGGLQFVLILLAGASVARALLGTPWSLLLPPMFAWLIFSLATQRGTWIERALLLPPVQFLGAISYSLYISHYLLRDPGTQIYRFGMISGDVLTCAYLAAAISLGWIVYRWIERPANDWLVARLDARFPFPSSAEEHAAF